MNKVEFSRTAKAPFEKRYGNFIGGKLVEPRSGKYFENHLAGQRPAAVRDRALERPGHRGRARRRARGQGAWGTHQRRRTRAHPQPDRRPHGGQSRSPGAGRDLGQRQADPRDDRCRPAAGDRSFPLFRRRHSRPGRQPLRDRPRYRRLSFPRAARRRRPDHSVELPAADGLLEAGAGACRRQLRGAEAGRADPGLDHGVDRT